MKELVAIYCMKFEAKLFLLQRLQEAEGRNQELTQSVSVGELDKLSLL
jgi:hypothetical protein